MTPEDRGAILEEEMIILRNSGEIPEIALYTSLYYLEKDEEGPQISLSEEELHQLYDAALARAREIVLRDLDPDNRDLGLYRGPARSIVNWQRLRDFCRRINRECPGFNKTVLQAFASFIQRELQDVQAGKRCSSVNCSVEELNIFFRDLRVETATLPSGWPSLCKK
jgi:hypothetical protein